MRATDITQAVSKPAEAKMAAKRKHGFATKAIYDARTHRIVVQFNTGLTLAFDPEHAQGLETASPRDLSKIEISPSGLELHWPTLDADLHLPGLVAGMFGSKRWTATQLGASGGRATSIAGFGRARKWP